METFRWKHTVVEEQKPKQDIDTRPQFKRSNRGCIYMKVTKDKYQLPIYVADSLTELAWICGVNRMTLSSNLFHSKEREFPEYVCVPIKEVKE